MMDTHHYILEPVKPPYLVLFLSLLLGFRQSSGRVQAEFRQSSGMVELLFALDLATR